MFTSKKAQYLDNQFNRISPMTNIDSLYYEQAEALNDGSILIHRKSFVKTMPIQFNKDFKISNIKIASVQSLPFNTSLYNIGSNSHIYLNTSIHIEEEKNPHDKNTNNFLYDSSLFKVISNKYVDLHNILNGYEQLYYFNSSVLDTCIRIDDLTQNISIASNYMNQLNDLIYNNDSSNAKISNDIYFIDYKPNSSLYMKIKVQDISINGKRNPISLDDASTLNNDTSFVEKWNFHYDINTSTLTYLKDEYGNEGSFDFRNRYIPNNGVSWYLYNGSYINSSVMNNKLYFDPVNSSIIFAHPTTHFNNIIYNSKNLGFDNSSNNIINNVNGAYIKGESNTIYNSTNHYFLNTQNPNSQFNASLYIQGNNNTIINCNDCSINITGNNNILINLKNQILKLGDNNVIIGDELGCPTNTKILTNDRLFLNQSSSTAITKNLTNYCTIFGGVGNDVSVYTNGFLTTNK